MRGADVSHAFMIRVTSKKTRVPRGCSGLSFHFSYSAVALIGGCLEKHDCQIGTYKTIDSTDVEGDKQDVQVIWSNTTKHVLGEKSVVSLSVQYLDFSGHFLWWAVCPTKPPTPPYQKIHTLSASNFPTFFHLSHTSHDLDFPKKLSDHLVACTGPLCCIA